MSQRAAPPMPRRPSGSLTSQGSSRAPSTSRTISFRGQKPAMGGTPGVLNIVTGDIAASDELTRNAMVDLLVAPATVSHPHKLG
jgi:hypothetical protein